jgi:cell division protein FtsW
LLGTIGIILLFGLIMLASASVAVGLARFGDGNFFIKRQLAAFALGLALAFLCYRLTYKIWQRISWPALALSLFLMLLVFIPWLGAGTGADRWLNFGLFTFQPSEMVKLSLIFYLAAWLESRRNNLATFNQGLLPFVGLMFLLFVLLIAQPDLGTLIVIGAIGMSMYFAGGAKISHFVLLIVASLIILALATALAPYRMNRITAFLHPASDPQNTTYHVNQAMIAIGSGGFFGRGLGQSRQKFLYLPETSSDSLFAVIAEELGFIGAGAVIILFLIVLRRGVRLARRAPDNFGKLAAVGITAWFAGQAFINIGAMTKVLPLTGVPLPLMSYGGSALVMSMMAAGVLLNISKISR